MTRLLQVQLELVRLELLQQRQGQLLSRRHHQEHLVRNLDWVDRNQDEWELVQQQDGLDQQGLDFQVETSNELQLLLLAFAHYQMMNLVMEEPPHYKMDARHHILEPTAY